MSVFRAINTLFLLLTIAINVNAVGLNFIEPSGNHQTIQRLYRVYIHCEGTGTPAIIIEAGIADVSANWLPIQKELSKYTQVCVYDRAGYGLSSPSPYQRTPSTIVHELQELLYKQEIELPIIMVGHSFGGYVAQYYAQAFPHQVAGLVLVDSSHPDQIDKLALLDDKSVTQGQLINDNEPREMSKEQEYWDWLNHLRKSARTQIRELQTFARSAEEVNLTKKEQLKIPVAVISRGKKQLPIVIVTYTSNSKPQDMSLVWQEMQKDLTNISSRSWQTISKNSGHSIHLDDPDIIVEHTLKVLFRSR
jgi:pimeloyl-ACP methyl ester carboxylesterase